jgi:DNA topoisomerase-3
LIEKKTYDAKTFLEELKQMVAEIVHTVLADNTNRRVAETQEDKPAPKGKKGAAKEKPTKTQKTTRKIAPPTTIIPATPPAPKEGDLCPLCGKGHIIKGKTAFGCSEWKNGCTFRAPLEISS